MTLSRNETVVIHELAKEMKARAGYPASVSVYERDGEFHYVALMGLTDEPNGSKRAAGMAPLPPGGGRLRVCERRDGRRLEAHRRPLARPEGGR